MIGNVVGVWFSRQCWGEMDAAVPVSSKAYINKTSMTLALLYLFYSKAFVQITVFAREMGIIACFKSLYNCTSLFVEEVYVAEVYTIYRHTPVHQKHTHTRPVIFNWCSVLNVNNQ